MSKKRVGAIMFLSIFLGGLIGWYIGVSSRVEVKEVKVVSLEENMLMFAQILEDYYGIETEEKYMFRLGQTNVKLEVLELQTFVTWLKTNGFKKCYYTHYKPSVNIGSQEYAVFWVWHEEIYYYWEL